LIIYFHSEYLIRQSRLLCFSGADIATSFYANDISNTTLTSVYFALSPTYHEEAAPDHALIFRLSPMNERAIGAAIFASFHRNVSQPLAALCKAPAHRSTQLYCHTWSFITFTPLITAISLV
jgi:hypothetical protein